MEKRVVRAFLKSAYDFSSVQMDFPDDRIIMLFMNLMKKDIMMYTVI